ncbi:MULTISPECIES: hypothetical protein [Cysteiniphilum]|uniref:Uncharacterized protein n=1 Tax=Cysteiniphilum litorale TaxID=2056700 RepID=A0A8J3EA57_9GAMM|nr:MULTISPECIES: hypothetical protein [Cysteiniphilum]GGG06152.1 hypothetical protein GCM10010995_24540 [Cysteiniphilum litorale]
MIYAFFYLAFCIYLGFFLKNKWAALLLAISVISWFVVRLPEVNADLSWRFTLTIIAYMTEFVVLLYFFPKKIIQLMRPNVQKNLIVAAALLVIFSVVVLFSSLTIPYMQQVLMQQANADINHMLSQISWLYRFGSFAGWLSFFSYLYLWIGLSRFIVKRPFGV